MQNHVSCLQSRANQLQREQDSAQLQLDVREGLLAVRDAWSAVIAAVLPASGAKQLPKRGGSSSRQQEQLQAEQQAPPYSSDAFPDPQDPLGLLSLPAASSNGAAADTGVSDDLAQQLPLLPALSQVDRWGPCSSRPAHGGISQLVLASHATGTAAGACLTASDGWVVRPAPPLVLQSHACGRDAAGCRRSRTAVGGIPH